MNTLTRKTSRKNKKSPEISRLIEFMQLMNLKYLDIEEKTGISKRTVENFVHNNLPIGVQLLRELHEKYGVSMDWLISGIGDMFVSMHNTNEPEAGYSVIDSRTWRLQRFIADFIDTATPDEQAWLEMQIKFSVPQYAQFLEQMDNDNG